MALGTRSTGFDITYERGGELYLIGSRAGAYHDRSVRCVCMHKVRINFKAFFFREGELRPLALHIVLIYHKFIKAFDFYILIFLVFIDQEIKLCQGALPHILFYQGVLLHIYLFLT